MLLNKFEKDGFINEPFEMKCLFCYNDNTYIQGKLLRVGEDYPLEIKLYNLEHNNYSYVDEAPRAIGLFFLFLSYIKGSFPAKIAIF